jgi:hypothetical protein
MTLDVHNHIWDCGGDETDVCQGQVGEEIVHGGVEVEVTADGKDDEKVPSTVTRYMDRNTPNRMGCISGSSESIVRWNSEICVRFFASPFLGHLF